MLDTPDKARSVADAYAREWTANSPDGIASFFTENAQLTVNHGQALVGHGPIAEMATEFYAAFADLQMQVDDYYCIGPQAQLSWTWQGTHKETGVRCTVSGQDQWNLNEEMQITDASSSFDTGDLVQQLVQAR